MNADDISDISSPLSSIPSSPLSSPPSSPVLPPSWHTLTPPPSQHAGDDMPPARKRRKIEPRVRTTQHLDLTSDTAQSEYDRSEALDTLLKALRNRRKIVVIAGAGISVSAGIPDFRSSHGLFKSLRGEHKLKSSGKMLFDASVYKDDHSTSNFHDMVRKLSKMAENAKPSLFHRFLARLSVEGRLLRLYTQNVDGLESSLPPLATQVPLSHKAPWPQTIQLHGGLEKMMCQKCRHISDFQAHLFDGPNPPLCPQCVAADTLRTTHAGKRSHGVGRLRPRIVLYNEHNPDSEAIGAVTRADFRTRPDAVIVVGTSMKIPAVRRIVHEMCQIVRDRREGTTIWINRDPVPPGKDLENCWDLIVKGDCDEVAQLAGLKEWDDTSADVAEPYTEADLEKVKSSQGEIKVVIPKPENQEAKSSQRLLPAAVLHTMTPPHSQNGDEQKKSATKQSSGSTPVRIKLTVGDRSKESAQVKNAASSGRSIADVLGKENKSKSTKSKTSLNKAAKVTKIRAQGKPRSQALITGRITKAVASEPVAYKTSLPEPLSPRRDSNETVIPPPKSEYSSVEGTPVPQTPPSLGEDWAKPTTVSPSGRIPSDMVRLLN
ncbi:NAD-dependent protein deacetylase hst4 [Exophiala dermatitidis]